MICNICNKEFKNNQSLSVHLNKVHNISSKEYYDTYFKKENEDICPTCGNINNFYSLSKGYLKYCSTKCSASHPSVIEKVNITCKDRYGENREKIIEKSQKFCLEKYGVISPTQLESTKQKIKETNLKRYGVITNLQIPEIALRSKIGSSSDECKEKRKNTNLERYGVENIFSCELIKQKIKETNILRYGVEYTSQSPIIREKIQTTIQRKYGVNCFLDFEEIRKIGLDKSLQQDAVQKRINTLLERYGVDNYWKYYNTHKNPRKNLISKAHQEIIDLLVKHNIEFKINDRKILFPFELDILIESHNLAIEYNGSYWHSIEAGKKNTYHQLKSFLCKDKDIQLIQIFECDWIHIKEIIKANILRHLGIFKREFNSEILKIKYINEKEKRKFLQENHILGNDNSTLYLGLFLKNTMYSILTIDMNNFKVSRFCNKLNVNVLNSHHKLFNFFINNYESLKINFNEDVGYENGSIPIDLGFNLIGVSDPMFFFINKKNKKYFSNSKLHDGDLTIWNSGEFHFELDI